MKDAPYTYTFVCMKWGTRYSAEYVNRLYRGILRGMQWQDFQLVCFTDDSVGVDMRVDCRPLPPFVGVPAHLAVKPWRKLTLWGDLGADLKGRDVLFLDLDVVITGDLRPFFDHEPGSPFVVWDNPTKPGSGVGNTSVFRFRVGRHPEILNRFLANPAGVWRDEFRIEQEMIAARLGDGRAAHSVGRSPMVAADPFYAGLGVMRLWPQGWCVSFKEDLLPGWPARLWRVPLLPPAARIVVFHGKPDPDEALHGYWPAPWWKRIYKTVRPTPWIGRYWE